MKRILPNLLILTILSTSVTAQVRTGKGFRLGLGIKAGVNIANVSGGADSVAYSHTNGLMAGAYLSPGSDGFLAYRSEFIFSRQGFKYKTNSGRIGQVTNDYILLPQLMMLNFSRYVQVHVGGQMGILLQSKDSNPPPSSGGGTGTPVDDVLKYFNRLDWGLLGGLEFYPSRKIMLGGRYNLGLSKLNKLESGTPGLPSGSYNPYNIDTKNSVIQLYAGLRF